MRCTFFYAILPLLLFNISCQKTCYEFEPKITYFANPCLFESRPSAFPPLTKEETQMEWGKEVRIGYAFAKEQDYYRAITAFKRALVLLPPKFEARKLQIDFCIVESYYFGYKYREAVESFESSRLQYAAHEFPAYMELLLILYDCYMKIDDEEKAECILERLNAADPERAHRLEVSRAFEVADLDCISMLTQNDAERDEYNNFIDEYCCAAKSVSKAQFYQAVLPGAGYLYVGQKNTAMTSFIINALFTWAAYRFFERGYPAAGIITASLETGWYLGGINGAGLAAKEYNERIWEVNAKEVMRRHNLFPVLMMGTSF